ncbi:MAG: HigA family addiction module antidote protein [Desulfofustis sp. PB-SRB1]|jgi:addiction module HigA family antidote|nr:HigA family addiction module antidote protein [Desulfofustis sp. PB-SRB1]
MVRIPKFREPIHPGEMLMEEFLEPMQITQRELSNAIHVPYQRINEIINGRRGITPSTALRLARYFGMSEDFWMNMQLRWDLYRARKSEEKELRTIKPYSSSTQSVHFS